MPHAAVLDFVILADLRAIILCADPDIEPDAHVGMEDYVADESGAMHDEAVIAAQLGATVANRERWYRHGDSRVTQTPVIARGQNAVVARKPLA